jgi:hypothetical protein
MREGIYQTFLEITENQHVVIESEVEHTQEQFALPESVIPQGREDFTSCRLRDFPDDFAFGTATAAF